MGYIAWNKGKKGLQKNPYLSKLNISRKGIPRTQGVRNRISVSKRGKPNIAVRGEKNRHWKGGVAWINAYFRQSHQYRLWKRAILERDRYICIWCGSKERLEVDHIKPFAYFPELRLAIDNGRVLCRKCHLTTESWGKK